MAAWLVTWLACLPNAHLMPTNPVYQNLCCVANIYKFIYVLSAWHSRYAMSIAHKSRKAKAGALGSCGVGGGKSQTFSRVSGTWLSNLLLPPRLPLGLLGPWPLWRKFVTHCLAEMSKLY